MANIKASSHGIVVEHKESGTRYAVSDRNYNPDVHRKIRDLRPGETVIGFRPKRKISAGDAEGQASGAGSPGAAGDESTEPQESGTETEGSSSEGTKGNK